MMIEAARRGVVSPLMSPGALAAVLWIAAGAFGSAVAAQASPQDEPQRAIRLLAGVPGDLDMALEGDFAQSDGLSLLGSIHRWSFGNWGCVSSIVDDGVGWSGPTQRSSSTCPPHGWAFSIGVRDSPSSPRHIGVRSGRARPLPLRRSGFGHAAGGRTIWCHRNCGQRTQRRGGTQVPVHDERRVGGSGRWLAARRHLADRLRDSDLVGRAHGVALLGARWYVVSFSWMRVREGA